MMNGVENARSGISFEKALMNLESICGVVDI
jgi:hypothetical protein